MSTEQVKENEGLPPPPPRTKVEWLSSEDKTEWADLESTDGGDILYGTDFCDLGNDSDSTSGREESIGSKKKGISHVRSLSGHFQNATKLSDPLDDPEEKAESPPSYPCQELNSSINASRKHRRVFSGGGSNPVMAHRRINSRGKSAFINRHYGPNIHANSNPVAPQELRNSYSLSPEPHERRTGEPRRGRSLSPPPGQYSNSRGNRRKNLGGVDCLPPTAGPPVAAQWLEHMRKSPAFDQQNSWPPNHNNGHVSYRFKDISHKNSYGNGPNYPPPSMPQFYPNNPPKPHAHQYPPPSSSYYSPHPPPYPYSVESSPSPQYYDDDTLKYSQEPYKPPNDQQGGHHPFFYPPPRGYPIQKSKDYPMQQEFWRSTDQKGYMPTAPPNHPLAADLAPLRPTRQSSIASSGSERIETDELLFANKGSNMNLSSSPHYRVSPQLFMQSIQSLRGSPCDFRSSPPSSIILGRTDVSAPHSTNEPIPLEINPIPHRQESSPDHFIREVGKSSHKRTATNDSLIQVEDTLGECLLTGLNSSPPNDLPKRETTIQLSHSPVISNPRKKSEKSPDSNSDVEGKKPKHSIPKRIRRKCTVGNCQNRVVQGGLCIAHGAKRKICGFPGCTKHVKKAGMCSAHGPARKRCDIESCNKVAVQGGKCIAHGAKKKLCCFDNCKKQAILSGMCKKHRDQKVAEENEQHICVVINDENNANDSKPAHRRGLSVFEDLNTVDTIIAGKNDEKLPTHGRGLSFYAEEAVANMHRYNGTQD